MNLQWHRLLLTGFFVRSRTALAAFSQSDEEKYLANFASIQAASYAVADGDLPPELNACKNDHGPPTHEVTVQTPTGAVSSAVVSEQCGQDSICILPLGTTLRVDQSLNVGALVVRGTVEWNDDTQVPPRAFVCAGYVAVEGHGQWDMDLQDKEACIYIKDNAAVHPGLRSRAFGSYAASESDYPTILINGRELVRTWSLLSIPIQSGNDRMTLMHNAHLMGWRVGDRIGVAPTEERARGRGEEFTIVDIDDTGSLLLDRPAEHGHAAVFVPPPPLGNTPALMSAEVVNLSRNILVTGDEFKHVPCDPNLPEAVAGEETSVEGCRCASFGRSTCTLGLHTAAMHGGIARIQNTRIERCGQRGVEGKYCLHFHKLHDCPTCLFKNNAIESSHQRGIVIHGTHSSTVEENVLYNVRGAGLYIEDGNEMYNEAKYNIVICPFPFSHDTLHGCTVPGTSNRIADTSDNQAGIFSRAATNSLIGNRVSNSFNGMLLKEGSIGRGESYGKVCESAAKLARYEGNTFHGNGRFGTYSLGFNYAKSTDQSILTDGTNVDKSLCSGFDNEGYERGLSASIVGNLDYHNAFVGHYEAGDLQYYGHHSYDSINLLYWKETKNFSNGCSAHISGGSYARGNIGLPDQATFLIEHTLFGEGVSLEANHHCAAGLTGVLCFPTYMFYNVQWRNGDTSKKWMWFQSEKLQPHNANQNHGGVFTLSPPDAQQVMNGEEIEHSIFPHPYVSLVSSEFTYLLSLPGQPCVLSDTIDPQYQYGYLFDAGILCKVPLRALKVYSQGQQAGSAPDLQVEMWYNNSQIGVPDSSQRIGFHQIGWGAKQGYSLPVIPSADHSYRLSLTNDESIPSSWVVEFSDFVVGNRFAIEYIRLSLNDRRCGQNGLVSSHHDRRFMWSGDEFMADKSWGNTGACAVNQPQDFPKIDCSSNDGALPADECPGMCDTTCNEDSSYCDCGSNTCKLKPGFTETSDLCGAARCSEHGACAARYLGGGLPVSSNACICDEGWSGSLCQYNPCEALGNTCSGHGTCIALSDTDATCQCEDSFSGDDCENSCNDICVGGNGGCATNIEGVVRYGCHKSGGCHYLREGEEYPYDGFCTYKQAQAQACSCGNDNDCEMTQSCNPDGTCPPAQYLPDSTPCNSVPFGMCQDGSCAIVGSSVVPTKKPTGFPTHPVVFPTSSPTNPLSPSPSNPTTSVPSKVPITPSPSIQDGTPYCGCDSCTQEVWDSIAAGYSCGARIAWLQSAQGYAETDACSAVASEFPDLCLCDSGSCSGPSSNNPTVLPSASPTEDLTSSPTSQPSSSPSGNPTTSVPSKVPITLAPSSQDATSYCGCDSCTQEVWDSIAAGYSCGARIAWLQSSEGYNEADACSAVASEFPDLCLCDLGSCSGPSSNNPTVPSSASPTVDPTYSPTSHPSSSPSGNPTTSVPSKVPITLSPSSQDATSYCGCDSCTQEVWDSIAAGYSCGARIAWLQSSEGYNEADACSAVASEFPDLCLCDLGSCSGPSSNTPTVPSSASPTEDPTYSPTGQPTPINVVEPTDQKCGGAVDFTLDPRQACQTFLWGPADDSSQHCFSYGGIGDPCHLNNNNDENDGIFKDPSLCLTDTFYLWDEPDTQGHDYSWAGSTWLDYSKLFATELKQLRSRGAKVTGPLLKAGGVGVLTQNMDLFFDACGLACSEPTNAAYIDIIAVNGFCGPWNGAAGCRGGAKFLYDEAVSVSSSFNDLPVYITNWSRLQTSAPLEQVDAIESIDEFFPTSGGVVGRVYWFGARDYGGGAETTGYLTNVLPDGRSLGEVWHSKCNSI